MLDVVEAFHSSDRIRPRDNLRMLEETPTSRIRPASPYCILYRRAGSRRSAESTWTHDDGMDG